ncbi:MAG: transporter substrate-binding domain-containing protein [Fibromonadaceae bacterium]|jgi:hypothetical protein|nr:transporter substrate-binding domain-containing protein [Fibromonadaceae bacterium]
MRYSVFTLVVLLAVCFAHSRNLASIRKDAFTVGVSRGDSAAEYDFISEITKKMKISSFRLVVFDNTNTGQKLLLDGKIDAIISRVNYSANLEGKFLYSVPYGKADIAAAVLASSKILTLSDLDGKSLAFIPKDVSNEQILGIWKKSKPSAVQNLADATKLLQGKSAVAIVATRKSLESQKDLRVFPNKILENNVVALFAPGSQDLQGEFNNALVLQPQQQVAKGTEKQLSGKERVAKMLLQLNELKKELELLQKELK